jgi:predicted Rossmann fold nucleotide-binding protein DprA/Smf involved in DNA uptake
VAIVGSREVSDAVRCAAEFGGRACAACGLVVYSGGARGVDGLAMSAAKDSGGRAVGILADSLEKAIRAPGVREALENGSITLLTPYAPKAGFTVGAAMARNKLIYALADYALVVGSDAEKGGTWAGATEALKQRWVPVFACAGPDLPEGNRRLLQRGALPFPWPFSGLPGQLREWLAARPTSVESQPMLFDNEP